MCKEGKKRRKELVRNVHKDVRLCARAANVASVSKWVLSKRQSVRASGKSYSDSPHCCNYLHSAPGAAHLQTAYVLQNIRERFKDGIVEEVNTWEVLG